MTGSSTSDFIVVEKSCRKKSEDGEGDGCEPPQPPQPTDLSFSEDCVLAVAFGERGVRLWMGVAPVGPVDAYVVETHSLCCPDRNVQRSVWIGNYMDKHSMITLGHSEATHLSSIMMHSFGGATTSPTLATESIAHQIRLFDACAPGHLGFVSTTGVDSANALTMLVRDGVVFRRSCTQIGADSDKTPTAFAIGNKLAVVGYAYPPGLVDGVGLVEVFKVGQKGVRTTRSIPQSVPTSLCTNGDRVLVGASVGIHWGHDTATSTVYCFSSKHRENYAVIKGGWEHPMWEARAMWMGPHGWCIARTIAGESGGRFSGIECADMLLSR